MIEQDSDFVAALMARHGVLENKRAPWEPIWQQIERRVNPVAAGGFGGGTSPGAQRGLDNFDSTAIGGLNRFAAAMEGMSFPRAQRWHTITSSDADLNKNTAAKLWFEHVADRLFQMRYAPHAGFSTQGNEAMRSLGSYGNGPLWVDEWVGTGIFYKAFHQSEIYVDEDFRGRVDTIHRKFMLSARQAAQQFELENLPDAIAQALKDNKADKEFEFLHVIQPNESWEPGRLGAKGKKVSSIYIAMQDKMIVRWRGYNTMPMMVSRYATSPRDIYGRSPAMNVLGTIKGLNEMAKTMLRAGHKAVDPALLYHDDGSLTKVSTKPGGLIPGGIDDMGRVMMRPLETGGNLPFGEALMDKERQVVNDEFLVTIFSILVDTPDRMTATEVLERAREKGLLLSPASGRQETELLGPMIERELDIGIRARQILRPPPEVLEAGATLRVIYDNPLSRAARSEEAAGFLRLTEAMTPLAQIDPTVLDIIDTDASARGLAETLGVRASWLVSPEALKAKRDQRAQAQQAEQLLAAAPVAGKAALDFAKAGDIAGVAAA